MNIKQIEIKKLSTGQDSTLKNYKKLAGVIGQKAVAFIQKKIDESTNGENEIVIADESQMILLLINEQKMRGEK